MPSTVSPVGLLTTNEGSASASVTFITPALAEGDLGILIVTTATNRGVAGGLTLLPVAPTPTVTNTNVPASPSPSTPVVPPPPPPSTPVATATLMPAEIATDLPTTAPTEIVTAADTAVTPEAPPNPTSAATLVTTKLGAGIHNLTATFVGRQANSTLVTPPLTVVAQKPGTTIPLLVLHNRPRTVIGGRITACDILLNTNGLHEPGCEIVSSIWLPGATVTYISSYVDGTKQTFVDTADTRGHSLHACNVAYLPPASQPGPSRALVLISVQAVTADGTTAGTTTTRFTAQR